MVRFPEWNTYIQVYVQNCIVEMMWTKIRNLQTGTPPGCLVTPPFNLFWYPEGGYRYTYISIIYYMLISIQIRFGKCLDKFLFNRSRASHVIMSHQTPFKSSKHLSVPFRSRRPFMVGEWEKSLIWNHETNFLRSACLIGKNRKHIPYIVT